MIGMIKQNAIMQWQNAWNDKTKCRMVWQNAIMQWQNAWNGMTKCSSPSLGWKPGNPPYCRIQDFCR